MRPRVVGVHGSMRATGVLISADGLVLTTTRVVRPRQARRGDVIEVLLDGGRLEEARLIGADESTGVCLIKVPGRDLPHFDLDGGLEDPLPGETVLTLSNATNSIFADYQVSASIGAVHSLLPLEPYSTGDAVQRYGPVMELSALSINTGCAGGAVVDMEGRLRGLLVEEIRKGVFLGQAIPTSVLAPAVERARAGVEATGSFIGGELERPRPSGVVIRRAPEDGPLARSGLEPGDIILAAAGQEVSERGDLDRIALGLPPGSLIPLLVKRQGRFLTVDLETAAPPDAGYVGVEWRDDGERGLGVTRVLDGCPLKLQRGDRVLSINGIDVDDLEDLEDLAGILYQGAEIRVRYRRGNDRDLFTSGKLKAPPAPPAEAAAPAEAAQPEQPEQPVEPAQPEEPQQPEQPEPAPEDEDERP
jgi:S1-C subfamily serine protease